MSEAKKPARILVIEDNDAHARLAVTALERAGYTCTRAAGAEQALDLIAVDAPDIVLMDVMLPGMNGLEAIRRLRANEATRALRVIAVTSHRAEFVATEVTRTGADAYIGKPYHYADLIELVRALLERRNE